MYAVGASLIEWICPGLPGAPFYNNFGPNLQNSAILNVPSGVSSADGTMRFNSWFTGQGAVLGLQLYGAAVSFNNATGLMELGDIATFSNDGECQDISYFDQTAQGAYTSWVLSSQSSGATFPSGVTPSSTTFYPNPVSWGTPQTDVAFLQTYNVGAYYGPGYAAYANAQNEQPPLYIDVPNNVPAPSFVNGAAIWLKANRISIGVFTSPTLFTSR